MLMQLVYTSRPFGFDPATLDDILMSARLHNRQRGVTGALIVRSDLYMQLLEGPREIVTATFARICNDDRHTEVALGCCADAAERLFPQWEMLDDPARSWLWSRAEVREGAVREASMHELLAVFTRLRAELAVA